MGTIFPFIFYTMCLCLCLADVYNAYAYVASETSLKSL